MTFAELVRTKPLSQVAFAAGIGKSEAFRLSNGGRIANTLDFVALADLFEVDLATLLLMVTDHTVGLARRGVFAPGKLVA